MTIPTRLPERTCVGCRKRAPAASLVRLALRDGRLVPWGAGRARPTGRGASLHAQADGACLRAALKAGAFARAFRSKVQLVTVDEADLLRQLTAREARG